VTNQIKYDLDAMREMVNRLNKAASSLEELKQQLGTHAKELDDGALVGLGGTAFATALRGTLSSEVDKLIEEYRRQARYVQKEIDDINRAIQLSSPQFS